MRNKCIATGTLGLFLIVADRLSKAWAVDVLRGMPGSRLSVIEGILSFRYAENTGAAFGLFSGMRLLNALLTAALLIALAIFIWRMREKPGFLAGGAIVMAGGLSHLYDRLLGQNIIDFIRLDFIDFPIFNVADICICAGTFLLGAAYILAENHTRSD